MRSGAPPAQQSRGAEHQRAGAYPDDIARLGCRAAQEIEDLGILEQRIDPRAPRNEDEIERSAGRQGGHRQDRQAVLGAHRIQVLPQQDGLSAGQPGQNLVGAGQVELGQIGEHHQPAAQARRLAHYPLLIKACFLSLSGE